VTSSSGDHLETEQKYDADTDFVLPDLGGRRSEHKKYYLSATYFDTEDLDLNQNKITLRRRVGGADEGWHLKLPVRKDTRREMHAALDDSVAGAVPARLAAQVEDIVGDQRLRPIAILDTERAVVPLTGQTGQPLVEVADDRVTATRFGGPDEEPLMWREIEVEILTPGPEATKLLETVGQKLIDAGARPSASGSKLGRLLQSLSRANPDQPDTLFALSENVS